jgi:hypothetical protein
MAAGCGGTAAEPPPRLATSFPTVQGSGTSPLMRAAFKIQDDLNFMTNDSTMEIYLGSRLAGEWIANNGRRGTLYFGVVHLTDADQRYARHHIHTGLHASFRLVRAKYNATQLAHFQAIVASYITRHTKGKLGKEHRFVSEDISVNNNAVDLGVPKSNPGYWLSRIQPLLPYDALVFHYASPLKDVSSGPVPDRHRPSTAMASRLSSASASPPTHRPTARSSNIGS